MPNLLKKPKLFGALKFCGSILLIGLITTPIHGQKQPLSRQDSALISKYLDLSKQAESKDDAVNASHYLNETAFIYWNHNFYEQAIKYYEESLTFNQKVANENGLAMLYNNLGMLYADVKEYEKSTEAFQKTLASRRANDQKFGTISALVNLSVVRNNLGRYDESIKGLEEALTLSRELNDVKQMRSVYGMLSETYQKAGNPEKSFHYFELYRTFHEMITKEEVDQIEASLEEQKIKQQIAEAREKIKNQEFDAQRRQLRRIEGELSKFDSINNQLFETLSKRELQLEIAKQDAEIRDLEAREQKAQSEAQITEANNLRNLGLVVAGFLLMLVIVIVRNYRHERKSKRELVKLNRLKDKLFSIIAHDLRSPLAALKNTLYMIEDGSLTNEEVSIFMDEIHKQANYNTDLLDNLLYWAKSQMEGIKVSPEEIHLFEIVDDNLNLFSTNAEQKEIKLINRVPKDVLVRGDYDMVKLVLRNLISNSLKFTDQGGEIEIMAEKMGICYQISVSDNGIGMDLATTGKLFNSDWNESTIGTGNEKGTGLGLMLCKEFITINNGTIKATSQKGKGTTITFTLPAVNALANDDSKQDTTASPTYQSA
ncbi:MAG: ATP-binding protein [Cyclobacteriaceae bacterium]